MHILSEIELIALKHPARHYSKRLEPVELIEGEIWLPIPKTNSLYHVSNLGRVKKEILLTSGKFVNGLLKPVITNTRLSVGLTIRPKYTVKTYIAKLVLMAFKPKPGQERMYVKHIDGDVKNCKLDNLDWSSKFASTSSLYENGTRAPKLKTKSYLNKHGKVKYKQVQFSEKDYEQIRELYAKGINQNMIATLMKCSQSFISNVIKGAKVK
jgi:hypothetical protein